MSVNHFYWKYDDRKLPSGVTIRIFKTRKRNKMKEIKGRKRKEKAVKVPSTILGLPI
jgi:hypothetical protein